MRSLGNFRKSSVVGLLLLVVGLVSGIYLVQQSQELRERAATTKRNVVVIMVDDLDVDSLNQLLSAGKLPNIKKYLIDQGTTFSNSFVSNSQCCPSRATFLTGKYSHNTGVHNVVGTNGGYGAFLKGGGTSRNIATWLTSNYYTAFIGKYLSGTPTNVKQNGWDYWMHVGGYDARPGHYEAHNASGSTTRPDYFQTKFIYDESIKAINAFEKSSDQNFFLWVAPLATHADLKDWVFWEAETGNSYPGTGEIVAWDVFNDKNDNKLQTLIRKSGSSYTLWYRGDKTSWAWKTKDSSWLNGSGNAPIVAFNSVQFSNDTIRYHLIRGNNQSDYKTYLKDNVNGVETGWTQPVNPDAWKQGTGDKPIVGWSIYIQSDGITRQEMIRGTPDYGYDLYFRMSSDWSTWYKAARGWDYNFFEPDNGPIVGWNSFLNSPNTIRHHVIKGDVNQGYRTYYIDEVSAYPVTNSNSFSLINEAKAQSPSEELASYGVMEEDTGNSESVYLTQATAPLYPDYPLISRVYADGNWENHQSYQSFSLPDYGGQLPAGSLRANGPDDFSPKNSSFALPGLAQPGIREAKDSFNKNSGANRPEWYSEQWNDLNSPAVGDFTLEDYLSRLHLDRMESLISIDVLVGKLYQKLQSDGLLNNTYIIFTSDNGYVLGEHKIVTKLTPVEESIRVPLIIRPPGGSNPSNNSQPVINVDLAPTILEASGRDWKASTFNVDGRSLVPLVAGNVTTWRDYILVGHQYPRDHKLGRRVHWLPDYIGIRSFGGTSSPDEYQYSIYTEDPLNLSAPEFEELYNITIDPYQVNNIISSGVDDNIKFALENLSSCSGESCRQFDIASSGPGGQPPIFTSPTPSPEASPTTEPTPTPTPIQGDLDGDNDIDIDDYNIFINSQYFGDTGNPGFVSEDIDENGIVDIFDFNLLITNFTG